MKLRKYIATTIREFLNEQNTINENDIEQWMTGECIPFCVALCELFPQYQIAVINDEFDDVDEDAEYNYNFVHAFCYHQNDEKIIIDAEGVRKLGDLYEDFYDINPVIDWDIPNSKYLIDNYAGKEFASEDSFEYDITEYQSAKEYISKNMNRYSVNLK